MGGGAHVILFLKKIIHPPNALLVIEKIQSPFDGANVLDGDRKNSITI
jgi:hypothetical protein